MKFFRIFFLSFFCIFSVSLLQAQNDAISTYFAKYLEDDESTVVYISGRMFDLMESVISNIETDDMSAEQVDALSEVVQEMRALRIVSRPGKGMAEYKLAKNALMKGRKYEVLMTVREKANTHVDFYIHETKDGIVDELLLLIADSGDGVAGKALSEADLEDVGLEEYNDGSFTMLSFQGRIAIDRIAQLAKTFED